MIEQYIPVATQLTMVDKSTDLTNSDQTNFDNISLPYGKEDERGSHQRLTPYMIQKLWVGEEQKHVKEVDVALTSTSKFHQVGSMVRCEL